MKRIVKIDIAFFVGIIVIASVLISHAQPRVLKENISPDITINVRKVIEGLYSSNTGNRIKSAIHLGEMSPRAAPAIPFLIGMLGDHAQLGYDNYDTESKWQTSLGISIDLPNLPIVTGPKKRFFWYYAPITPGRAAAWALGKIKNPQAVKLLIAVLKDEALGVRMNAAVGLGMIKDSRAVGPLIATLNDKILGDRESGAEAFGNCVAVWALGELKDSGAVESLSAALKDKDFILQTFAANALGKINDFRAVEPLIFALKDENVGVRESAPEALGKITGKNFWSRPSKMAKMVEAKQGRNFKRQITIHSTECGIS